MKEKLLALAAGAITHTLFALGVGAMVLGLHDGLADGLGTLHGRSALVADALLVLQFPVLHSLFLSRRGGRVLQRLVPLGLGRDLMTTTYAAFASLQIALVFLGWSPLAQGSWRPEGALRVASEVAFAASWLLLGKAMLDAGLDLQTGSKGWWAVFRGREPRFGPFPRAGLFRACRQPVYLSFALTLWTGPVWTFDRLALALVWTAYCFVGPLFKERRYAARHGEEFRAYQRRVSYFLPLRRSV